MTTLIFATDGAPDCGPWLRLYALPCAWPALLSSMTTGLQLARRRAGACCVPPRQHTPWGLRCAARQTAAFRWAPLKRAGQCHCKALTGVCCDGRCQREGSCIAAPGFVARSSRFVGHAGFHTTSDLLNAARRLACSPRTGFTVSCACPSRLVASAYTIAGRMVRCDCHPVLGLGVKAAFLSVEDPERH